MDLEQIKEITKIAREAVKDEEEPYKTEGFKIILSSLIGEVTSTMKKKGKSKSNSKSKHSKRTKTPSATTVILKQKNELSDLAKKCNISVDTLSEVITIKNNIVQIIKRPNLKEKQKHLFFSLCILTAYKILYEIEWLSSSILRKSLDESAVGDLGHSAEALSTTPLIANRGSRIHTEYKITGKGVDTAIEIIKKLAKDEPIVES